MPALVDGAIQGVLTMQLEGSGGAVDAVAVVVRGNALEQAGDGAKLAMRVQLRVAGAQLVDGDRRARGREGWGWVVSVGQGGRWRSGDESAASVDVCYPAESCVPRVVGIRVASSMVVQY